jgi:hypothetical protein
VPLLIPEPLLEHATEEELEVYLRYLESEAEANPETGEWVLQDRQQRAEDLLTDLAKGVFHELLYGGAVGGGKTDFLLWHLHSLARRYRNFHGLLLRRTFPELRRTVVIRALERFDQEHCRWVSSENTWKFDNGSTIEFGYCESDRDVYQYQSAEYDVVAWDELTQFPTDVPYKYLFTRLRTSVAKRIAGLVPHVIAGTNPGGVGGAWVKARFIDVAPAEMRVEHTDERGMRTSRVFVPAKLADNRFIDEESYRAALSAVDEDLRLALEEGSWDVVYGQYFSEWKRDLHVIKPFVIPPWWTAMRGIDYGYSNPFAALCGAFDPDETCYLYREHYGTGLTPPLQAKQIIDGVRAGDPPTRLNIIDPSTFAKTGIGRPIAQQYNEAGLPVQRGLNARVAGWQRVREYLRPQIEVKDEFGRIEMKPRLYIFENCVNLIRTLPMLVRDDKDPEDLDSDGEDHAADALRYMLMARPARPRKPRREATTLAERRAEWHRERSSARARERQGMVDHGELGRI